MLQVIKTQLKTNGRWWLTTLLSAFICLVFINSLFFKFTLAPETVQIFGRLEFWGHIHLGIPGLFAPTGVFGPYAIGSAELLASSLLILGALCSCLRGLQLIGALLGLAIMSGAIFFHLFTPLGVEVNNDGGALFITACLVWLSNAAIVVVRRSQGCALLKALALQGK